MPAPRRGGWRLAAVPFFFARGLLVALACPRERPHDGCPEMRLLADEAELEDQRDALRPMLEHYALPVTQAEPDAFMRDVRVQGSGADLALGTQVGVEVHGGGYLRLQIFLPYAKPNTVPPLPRMLIRWPESPSRLLSLLIELEPDPAKGWSNRQAQQLSVEALMRRVCESYLVSRPAAEVPIDHSNLHLVELLVAYGRMPGFDFAPAREHLLGVELAQEGLDPKVADTLRAHHAESLGHLLGAPRLVWDAVEKERAKRWLRELEERHFPDAPDEVEPLAHLGRGLRLVREHRTVLE